MGSRHQIMKPSSSATGATTTVPRSEAKRTEDRLAGEQKAMKTARSVTTDANEAVAQVAYQLSEVIAIYPITPSSTMGEWADQWAAQRQPTLWGSVPSVASMQTE